MGQSKNDDQAQSQKVKPIAELQDTVRRHSLYIRDARSGVANHSATTRNLQLDFLRFVAILGVLMTHTTIFCPPSSWWGYLIVSRGWTGVDLFFVLSGFLISGLLFSEYQRTKNINFGRFAIRRALKLYPTLYFLVFGVMFFRLIRDGFAQISTILTPVLHDIFFVQSYLPGTYGHFWSLSVEEHFYILLPFTLYFMLRWRGTGDPDPFRGLPLLFLMVAIFSLSARIINAIMVQPYSISTHLFPTHFRMDSLLFGVLLSYWYRFHPEKFRVGIKMAGPWLFPLSFLLLAPTLWCDGSNFFTFTFLLSLNYLGYGLLLIASLELQIPLRNRYILTAVLWPFIYIGRHSYPIYVFHILVASCLQKFGLLQGWSGLLLYFTSTFSIGIVISKLIEFPVLRVRDRIFPPRVQDPVPAPLSFPAESQNLRLDEDFARDVVKAS